MADVGLALAQASGLFFLTMGAEQFGNNIRATAATTIPNMVRGMLAILILPLFQVLRSITDYYTGGWIVAIIIMAITIVAAILSNETFHKDLAFIEYLFNREKHTNTKPAFKASSSFNLLGNTIAKH